MSTYSVMATRAGTSRRDSSSKTPQRRIARSVRSMRVSGQVGGSAAWMIGSICRCAFNDAGDERAKKVDVGGP